VTTETKHTPGPWVLRPNPGDGIVSEHGGSDGYPHTIGTVGGYLIANVCQQAAETEANARLIAAAPDLLAALKTIAESWERGFNLDEWRDAMDDAHSAIAKAEGRTP
jgi:hypothetical protein